MTRSAISRLQSATKKQVKKEGLRPFADRTGVSVGQVRSMLDGRASSATTIEKLAEALDLEFYIGPSMTRGSEAGLVSLPSDKSLLLAELIDIFSDIEGTQRQRVFVEAARVFAAEAPAKPIRKRA